MLLGVETQFLFATCQVGAERVFKEEMAQRHPGLRPAFSRPGFMTFKSDAAVGPDFELGAVFARAYGVSLGEVVDATVATDERVSVMATRLKELDAKPVVQVWLRESASPGEDQAADSERALYAERLAAAFTAAGVEVAPIPPVGRLVHDVIVVEPDSWWLGAHRHTIDHPPTPIQVRHPPEAPSRAYLKVEEAIRWFELQLREGDTAIELGSAPGGVVYALLARGLKVVGVDPGEMAPSVKANKRFKHLAMSAFDIRESDVPKRLDWILLDMNTEPELGLRAVQHLIRMGRAPTYGVILTLKLNAPSFSARIPELVNQVRARGFAKVYAKQLSSNRREITVVGVTERGLRRT